MKKVLDDVFFGFFFFCDEGKRNVQMECLVFWLIHPGPVWKNPKSISLSIGRNQRRTGESHHNFARLREGGNFRVNSICSSFS